MILLISLIIIVAGGVFFFLTQFNLLEKINVKTIDENQILYELWETRQYTAIIDRCHSVLNENPLHAEALVLSGFSYFYEGVAQYSLEDKLTFFNNAVINLRKAELIEEHPFPGGTKYVLGKTYYHKGPFYMDLAIKYLEDSIQIGYIGDDTYEYLGLAYSELEKYEKSIEYFLQAAEKNPSDILFLTLAQTYYKMDDMTLAEEYLIRSINKTDDVTIEEKSRFLLGRIYLDREEYLKAENQYLDVLENNPNSADAHFNLGKIYEKMGDEIKARAEWRKALLIDPTHYGARLKYYK